MHYFASQNRSTVQVQYAASNVVYKKTATPLKVHGAAYRKKG